jgi:hypothetical protein
MLLTPFILCRNLKSATLYIKGCAISLNNQSAENGNSATCLARFIAVVSSR